MIRCFMKLNITIMPQNIKLAGGAGGADPAPYCCAWLAAAWLAAYIFTYTSYCNKESPRDTISDSCCILHSPIKLISKP